MVTLDDASFIEYSEVTESPKSTDQDIFAIPRSLINDFQKGFNPPVVVLERPKGDILDHLSHLRTLYHLIQGLSGLFKRTTIQKMEGTR